MANGIEFNQNSASVFNSNSLDFELESQQLTQKSSSNTSSPLINLQNELAMITSSSLSGKKRKVRQPGSCSMICKSCLLLPIAIN